MQCVFTGHKDEQEIMNTQIVLVCTFFMNIGEKDITIFLFDGQVLQVFIDRKLLSI